MVFAFVTPRRCPARKVTEIQTALRSSEHNHTHHRLSCFSLPTGQKLPKWSVFLKNFLFRADLPFHGKLAKTLVPSGFPDFSAGRVGYFRNFFYRLFFRPYRIVFEKSVIDRHHLPKRPVPSGPSDGSPDAMPSNTHWRKTVRVVRFWEKKSLLTSHRSKGCVLVYGFEKKVSSFPTAHELSKWSAFSGVFSLQYPLEGFAGFERKILKFSSLSTPLDKNR